jgi:hypothetical protein
MQKRGEQDEDSDKNDGFMIPDDMQQGPIGHVPVHIGPVARRARDELSAEASTGISKQHPRVLPRVAGPATYIRIKAFKFYILLG